MQILGVVHGEGVRAGVFGDAARARGHPLEEWSPAWGTPPPRPIDSYCAVIVFGGSMHADQESNHPWLREENLLLERLLNQHRPLLGVCLGAQLIAKAAHSWVAPADKPEIGWYDVELTDEAQSDPVLGRLPSSFPAFQWHYYTHGLPAGAVELARSEVCTQAFRLGDSAWGVQFHPEVSLERVEEWLAEDEPVPIDRDAIRAETHARIGEWNELGRKLCDAFIDVAERVATPA